jgi:predicted RNA binding protein YcfA (HicA-like mRNA interferase family)
MPLGWINRTACAAAGLQVTLHGLRRSFASLCEWLDIPGGISAQIQGHAPQGVREQNYIRRPLDLLRVHHEKLKRGFWSRPGLRSMPRPRPVLCGWWQGDCNPIQQRHTCTNRCECVPYTQMTSNDLIRDMQRAGWQLDRVNGSHHIFKHPSRPGIVVVPHPKKDLGQGLVKAIRRQAGI